MWDKALEQRIVALIKGFEGVTNRNELLCSIAQLTVAGMDIKEDVAVSGKRIVLPRVAMSSGAYEQEDIV